MLKPRIKCLAHIKEHPMKRKLLLIVMAVFLALPSASFAEGTGLYLAPKFLMSLQNTGTISRSWSLAGSGVDEYDQFTLGGAFAVGFDLWQQQMIPLRLEVEVALRGNSEHNWSELGFYTSEVKALWNNTTLFANVFWDFHNDTPFTPYIGGGLGLALNYTGYEATLRNGETISADDRFTNFAWNVGAGFSYDVNEFLAFDASYRFVGLGYNEVSKTVNGVTATISNEPYNNEFMVGLRFNF